MDYLLAAHIQVTGGAEATAQFNNLATSVSKMGAAASAASTGGLAAAMDKGTESAGKLVGVLNQVAVAATRMATYQALGAVFDVFQDMASGVVAFDDKMTQSLAIQTGVTGKMRTQMEDLAKSIAVDLGMAPAKVAEGFYFLASAGLTVEQQLNALPVVAQFAAAGMFTMEKATEKLYDSLTALGLKSENPQEQLRNLINLSDLLVTAAIASQGSVQDFTTSLANKAGGDIKSYGIDLKEGIALLEVFADRGIKGAKAGTAFDITIRDMAIKAVTNADAFKKFGIEVYDSAGNFNSLSTIFQQLDAALLHLPLEQRTAALAEMGYTLRSGQIIQSLLGTTQVFNDFKDGLDQAGGTAERVAMNQMESLRAKMNQLKSLSIVFAIEGFEQLQDAAGWLAETFAPAVLEIIDLMNSLAQGAKPVAAAFAGVVSAAVQKALEGLAAALSLVFGVINDHPGLIEGVGAALAGLAAVQIISAVANIGTALGTMLYSKILMVQDAINALIIKMLTIAQTEGVFAAVRVGLSGIVSALTSPVAIGAGIGLAILAIYKGMQDAEQEAENFRKGLEQQYDTSSILGMNLVLDRLVERMDGITAKHKGNFFASIFDVFEIKAAEDQVRKANDELANMTIGIQLLANMATGSSLPMTSWAKSLENAGMDMKDFPIDEMRGKFDEMGVSASAAGANTEQVGKLLTDLAKASGIDIKNPIEDWGPKLAEAWVNFTGVRDIASEIGGVAEGSSSGMSSMEKAITTLKNEAATAEDKLKALKEAMDGLSGGTQNLFDMETKFSEGMEKFRTTLEKNGTSMSSFTEAGRENRDMLSDMTDRAKDYALGQAEVSGNMQVGVEHLKKYAEGIADTMRKAGAAEPAIQELLRQMGLTPAQIETLFKMTLPEGEPAKTQGELDAVADPRLAAITPETDAAAKAKTEEDLGALASARTVSVEPYPDAASVLGTEDVLTNTARRRDSEANQYGTGWPTVDDVFNRSSRKRDSQADQFGTGFGSVNHYFDSAARYRESQAYQYADTATAEWELNQTARPRTAWITVAVHHQSSDVYAGPEGFGIAEGGIVHAYAQGGFENHVAQIGKMGASRIWNEPETGGEAYIPLAQHKRDRSLAIWEETGRLLGARSQTNVVNTPVHLTMNITGTNDPETTGRVAAEMAGKAIDGAMRRVLVEMQTA